MLSHSWYELLWRKLWDWTMHKDLIAVWQEMNRHRLDILSVNTILIKAEVYCLLILVNHLRRKRIPTKLICLHCSLMMLFCLIPCEFFNVCLL